MSSGEEETSVWVLTRYNGICNRLQITLLLSYSYYFGMNHVILNYNYMLALIVISETKRIN